MKITLRPVIWTHKVDKDGLCPIAISIAGGGKQSYFNTGIKCPEKYWNGKTIDKGHPNYDIKNSRIETMIKDAERELLIRQSQGENITLELAKSLLSPDKPTKGGLFLPFAKTIIEGKNAGTKRRYTFELDKIKEYAGEGLKFGQITPEWLSAYYKYLRKENSHNTAINAFKVIRHTFNEAREKKLTSLYPFKDWKYPQYQQPKKEYLTLEECNELFKILESQHDKSIKLVTAFFLLECFAGLRVSDWHKFNVETMVDNRDLVFTTTKTKTPVRIPIDIMPSLKRVVDYIAANNLKYTETGEHANRMLKAIKGIAGINKNLTTHVGRHTCASLWLNKGMNKTEIGIMLGITERQASTYSHASANIIRNAVTRLGSF